MGMPKTELACVSFPVSLIGFHTENLTLVTSKSESNSIVSLSETNSGIISHPITPAKKEKA